MSSLARLAGLATLLMAIPVVGCAANTEEVEDPATGDAAVTSASEQCGSAKYNEALGHYKKAVALAKQRPVDACIEEGGGPATLADIAGEAQKAVAVCGAFKKVIKTSPWAGALRQELSGSLAYPILTGDLDPSNWRNLASALEGVTMYGPAPGAYGNVGKITFEANGRGYLAILNLTEEGEVYWGRTDMRWSVQQQDGATKIKVVAEYENEEEQAFDYLLKKGESYYGGDNYVLELQGETDAPGAYQTFDTYPSECEA